MERKLLTIYIVLVAVLAVPFLVFSKKLNIFYPNMKPVSGDWGSPSHRIGENPVKLWTESTTEAAVNQKPLQGKITIRSGELLDLSCYLQLGKHGETHADCGKLCILNGQPIGLLEDNGAVYLLLPEEHHSRRDGKTVFAQALSNHVGQIVEVTGTMTNVKGMKTIYVQGFVKKE